ncbi:MAG: sensor histidine kinase [Eubacteriales bacterium]
MTIKKQWLMVMIFISMIAIIVNSLLYSILIDKHFISYIESNYKEDIKGIQEYSHYVMKDKNIALSQIKMEMQKYLDDPITAISLYDLNGSLILSVEGETMRRHGQMMMMGREAVEERDSYDIVENNQVMGKLIITRQGSVEDSITSIAFKSMLLINSIFTGGFVLILSIIISIFISRKTGKDLINTANYAKSLDINEELDLRESNVREIKEIQNSLKQLAIKLKLKQKSRKQKVDMLMHQARTPLTILKSNIEGTLDEVVEMDQNRLENCIHQVDHLTNMISHLTDVIEMDQEESKLQINQFDVVEECRRIIKGFKIQFANKGIELAYKGLESQVLWSDSDLFNQAIYNLITNAYKFTHKGGSVTISVKKYLKDTVTITVEDNGIGIPEKTIPHVFEAYYRSTNATEITGQGLGLFVVKNNIERIHGKISIASQLDKGTKIEIMLPVRKIISEKQE